MRRVDDRDTKRSEDVRARMGAISELPETWRRSLGKWRQVNRRWKKTIDEAQAPDPNEEYLLYQILLGSLPLASWGEQSAEARAGYIARIQEYMTKAMKEAKVNTSLVQPNEEWDGSVAEFVSKLLEPGQAELSL